MLWLITLLVTPGQAPPAALIAHLATSVIEWWQVYLFSVWMHELKD